MCKSLRDLSIYTTLRLKQRKLCSRFFVLARKDSAGLLAASQGGLTQSGRKRCPQNRWFKLRGVLFGQQGDGSLSQPAADSIPGTCRPVLRDRQARGRRILARTPALCRETDAVALLKDSTQAIITARNLPHPPLRPTSPAPALAPGEGFGSRQPLFLLPRNLPDKSDFITEFNPNFY